MIRPLHLVELNVDISASLVALVTLATVLVFGLATLPRPSRATITWGIAFAIGMLGTYVWVAAQQLSAPVLQAVSSGMMLTFEAVIWLGLRFFAGRKAIWWPVVGFVVLAPAVLGVAATTDSFPAVFRVVFLVGAIFAALIMLELFRLRDTSRDLLLPLALASFAFVVVAIIGFVAGLVGTGTVSSVQQLSTLRDVNGIGTLLTGVCTAFTLVLLVRTEHDAQRRRRDDVADRSRRRLLKARAQGDPAWAVLDVRLDDPDDLRQAWTGAVFSQIVDTFHDHVLDVLPASSDAERVADDRILIVIRGSDEAIQYHLRTMLARVSSIDEDGPAVRVSASIGWAGALLADYDYDELVRMAATGAESARRKGCDRWEQVTFTAAS